MFVIFDPAPTPTPHFRKYPDLAAAIDILKPNETEASLMTGQRIRTLEEASQALFTLSERGIGRPIITLGNKGAVTLIDGNPYFSPAYPVSTVDTTAAGDVFSGALAACLAKNKPFVESRRRRLAGLAPPDKELKAPFPLWKKSPGFWKRIDAFRVFAQGVLINRDKPR